MDEQERLHCQRCGHPTEERPVDGRARPVCAVCGTVTYLDPKLAVAVVVARGGRVLLGRRAAGASQAGRWSFPAGYVERGETVEAAAAREAREEVGLEVAIGPLVGLYSRAGEAVVLAVYAADADGRGEPVAGDDLDAVGWFALDALPELAFSHDGRILDDWRSRVAAPNPGNTEEPLTAEEAGERRRRSCGGRGSSRRRGG